MGQESEREEDSQLVLLRLSGDVSTKARRTRYGFVSRLIGNLRDALESEGLPTRLRIAHDRLFAELPRHCESDVLTRVFGVQSISWVQRSAAHELDAVVAAGERIFRDAVRGRRFAVRARRVGDRSRIALRARDLERDLGTALLSGSAGVDLDRPEVVAHVELFEEDAYFFPERVPAAGGLPLGVEGRAVALVSGGFDSAVAAWQMMRRGVALDHVFCRLGGAVHQLGALRVSKCLAGRWSYGDRPLFHALDFEPVAEALREHTRGRLWQVLLKRLMLRAAEAVAAERRAAAIVTGECVGQVSSQTLHNLAAITPATALPVLRPLVGLNKEEIIAIAERIGTFELSKVVGEYCALVPSKPATRASVAELEAEEAKLDPELIPELVARRDIFDLREIDPDKLERPELQIERIPEGATVIDLRSRNEYRAWHWPGALWLDFPQAVRGFPHFDRSQTYVLYCEFGLKSAHLADLMRRQGFQAHHFRGGTPALRRLR
jgi:thiamine biosynthesis protein ThiI